MAKTKKDCSENGVFFIFASVKMDQTLHNYTQNSNTLKTPIFTYLLGITKLALGPLGSIDPSNLTSPSNSTLEI